MKRSLDRILKQTLDRCFKQGNLKESPLPDYVIEVPANAGHGHFATNLAMTLASGQGMSPRDIAEIIIGNLVDKDHFISKAETGGPGFINFFISAEKWRDLLRYINEQGENYGRSATGNGKKVMVEFVSANPTGPLHLGHGRGAALGDTLCRILDFCGFDARREFYINDAGQQVRLLGESIYSRWRQSFDPSYPFPPDGYQGEYIQEVAEEISKQTDLEGMNTSEAVDLLARLGRDKILQNIKQDLAGFGVNFDCWYRETDLYESGKIDYAIRLMQNKGLLYEKDGALWIKTSGFGDDKDRVLKKKDGQFTYFASDISYHLDKWERGFNRIINIWGADHHGYVDRVKSALKAEGIPDGWMEILLIQLVKLWHGKKELKMSKRAGRYITLKELVEEVGVDAVRFVFLTKDNSTPVDFDVNLVKKKDNQNPVYYVQYAHARICSLSRKAESSKIRVPENPGNLLDSLALEEEVDLIRKMDEFPLLVEEIAGDLAPHRLTYYLTELAGGFHKYYNRHRILCDDISLTRARLYLCSGLRLIIKNGLNLLGVSSPDNM